MITRAQIIHPKERFVTYGVERDVSDSLLRHGDEGKYPDLMREQAKAQARHEAQKVDKDAPVILTITHVEEQPRPDPFTRRWRIYIQVEFQVYFVDPTRRFVEEWAREQARVNRRIDEGGRGEQYI